MTEKEPRPSTAAENGEPAAEAPAQPAARGRRRQPAEAPAAGVAVSRKKAAAKPAAKGSAGKPAGKAAPAKAAAKAPAAARKGPAAKSGAKKPAAKKGAAKKPAARKGAAKKPATPRPPKLTPQEVAARWAAQLDAERPGLVSFVLDHLNEFYGRPVWDRRQEPTSELVLTILSQNSADTNAEAAFEELRKAYPSVPVADGDGDAAIRSFPGWGGQGLRELPPPDWERVENAPLPELIDVIRPGGLAPQKAPRVQAALAAVRGAAGGYSLEFLGEMPALEARQWMTQIPGIGPKTASVVLLFSFGTPLMPVDRHVERVSQRIGLLPPKADANQAHDIFLALLEPDQMYEAHVDLIRHGREICHARNPECGRCPIAPRCRYFLPDAP